ncbi:MAG: hypothetical protein ACOX4B_09435 [Bacillota bacterium]
MSIWEKLSSLDRRYYYVVLILVVALPIIKPWGLPIRVGSTTEDFWKTVEAVPEGGTIALAIDYRSDCIVELNPQVVTLFRQAFARNLKIIMWSNVDEGANVTEPITRAVGNEMGKTYGVDWVNLGYKPGGEVTMKKMVDNFWEGAAYVDMQGTPLQDLPIMQGFSSLRDADLLIDMMAVVPSPAQNYLKMVSIRVRASPWPSGPRRSRPRLRCRSTRQASTKGCLPDSAAPPSTSSLRGILDPR